jgi:predicted AlkP superfamily phosphohydrolase/phosphomutase
VFTILDRIQHRLLVPSAMTSDSVVMDYYALLDSCVSELMEMAGPEVDVVIISDHGMGPSTWAFNLNDWLRSIGLLSVKNTVGPVPRKNHWLHKAHQALLPLLERSPHYIRLVEFIKSVLGVQRLDLPGQPFHSDLVDWGKTKAYAFGNHGEIFLNLKGREPKGIVTPGEAEEIYGYIERELRSLEFPWNVKSMELIYGRDVFEGPYRHKMPDLFIKIDDYECLTSSRLFNPTLFFRKKGGHHRPKGVFMALGPSFTAGKSYDQAHIMDIAPTLLQILKVPLPKDMDGRVLQEVLSVSDTVSYQETSAFGVDHAEYSEEEEKALFDHLRSLGYL